MLYYSIKVLVSALLIVIISEVAKRNTIVAALVTSLPIIALLSILWLYWDTGNVNRIAELSKGIFCLVLPSLVFFISLPTLLLQFKIPFYLAMLIAILLTVMAYAMLLLLLSRFGIKF
ncbi:MAG: DUF3147 family protein [Pseudomonadota bacterium]